MDELAVEILEAMPQELQQEEGAEGLFDRTVWCRIGGVGILPKVAAV